MPNPYLCGNGYNCPACGLRRETDRDRTILGSGRIDCNHCNGTGRIAHTEREANDLQLADARRHHWKIEPENPVSLPEMA